MHGILLINKIPGIGSTGTLNQLKRILNVKKLGHAGTLDPFAQGLLPVAVGEGTKILEYLTDYDKEYICRIQFGSSTDTQDLTGKIIETSDKIIAYDELLGVLPKFIGQIEQIPPKYSAIKINGERAYNLARQNIDFEIKSRQITISSLKLLEFSAENQQALLQVSCSKGTYIRTLAQDIAEAIGGSAHLIQLVRTKVGKFTIEQSFLLDNLKELVHNPSHDFLIPIQHALDDIPAVEISQDQVRQIRCGQQIETTLNLENNSRVLLISQNLSIAIGQVELNRLQPIKVFNT